jgi:anti-anti-sigma factor
MTARLRQQVPLPSLSSHDHDGVTVVSLRGELDFCGSSALRPYLSGTRRQTRPRSVADLTDLDFIDCACLTVLARHCKGHQITGRQFRAGWTARRRAQDPCRHRPADLV